MSNSTTPGKKKDENSEDTKNEDNKETRRGPELTDEQQVFLDRLFEEMHQVESFKNNPGRPEGELKTLDADAVLQLESHLSIDDQYAPSTASLGYADCPVEQHLIPGFPAPRACSGLQGNIRSMLSRI